MWVRDHAVAKFPRSSPFGNSAIGVRSVSWVGVIDDLTIHSSGPSPTINRKTSVTEWTVLIDQRKRRPRQSAAETRPRSRGLGLDVGRRVGDRGSS